MAEKKNPKSSEAESVKPEPKELPIGDYVGLVKVTAGWTVVGIRVQGDKIIDREAISKPGSRAYALEKLKVAVVRTFLWDRKKTLPEVEA